MALRICFPRVPQGPLVNGTILMEVNNALICRDIPALIVEIPTKVPRPLFTRVADAIRLVLNPRSESWVPPSLVDSGLDEQTIRDARVLATINALTETLSPSLRGSLESSVIATAKRLEIPADAEITIAA